MNVAVILPTYNEEETIQQLITVLEKEIIPKVKNHAFSILIVDDKSSDKTEQIIKTCMKRWNNIFLSRGNKQGLGAAYIRGMSYATKHLHADILIGMDADGQHDAHIIPKLLKKIDTGYAVVVGSRYIRGGSVPANWNILRKFLSAAGNRTLSIVLGVLSLHDWTGSYRAIRKDVFLQEKRKLLVYKNNTFFPALLYEAICDGYTITEVPIHFKTRAKGKSKIDLSTYIIELTKYVVKRKVLRRR